MSNRQNETQRPRRADFQQALKSMDTYMDITVDDLMTLSQRAEQFANRRASEAIQVSHIMSQPVRSVRPQTPLSEAAHLMVTQRISGLPVVDEADHLAGMRFDESGHLGHVARVIFALRFAGQEGGIDGLWIVAVALRQVAGGGGLLDDVLAGKRFVAQHPGAGGQQHAQREEQDARPYRPPGQADLP